MATGRTREQQHSRKKQAPPLSKAEAEDIALEHGERAIVAGRIHHLRQVDDDRAIGCNQHIELRQIPVYESDIQHPYNLLDEKVVIRTSRLS